MNILVRKYSEIEANINSRMSMQGEYTLSVYKADGTLKRSVGPFKNLITNQGLNSFGGAVGAVPGYNQSAAFVGTGTAVPSATDTTMSVLKRYTIDLQNVSSTNRGILFDWAMRSTVRYRFAAGTVTGNITEVGIGVSNLGAQPGIITLLFSRALIVDGEGNPVTLTVLADEFLDVTYTLDIYPDLNLTTQVVKDGTTGIDHTFQTRIVSASSGVAGRNGIIAYPNQAVNSVAYRRSVPGTPITFSADLTAGLLGAAPLTDYSAVTVVPTTYEPDSFSRKVSISYGLNAFNPTAGLGIEAVTNRNQSATADSVIASIISPPIMKTNSKILNYTTSISWARK